MTGVSSASSSNLASYPAPKKLFSKLDTDGDGTLTKQEFLAGRPPDVSEEQASALISKIDTDEAGAVSEDQLEQSMASSSPALGLEALVSSGAMSVLMALSGGMPSASDLYAGMDTDGDGKVSRAEFLAAKPDDLSDDDAEGLYDAIDTENAGSITEEQFSDSLQEPRLSGISDDDAAAPSEGMYDTLDANRDGVVSQAEFVAGHPADITEEQAVNLFRSFDADNTGSVTSDEFSASVDRQQNQGSPDAKVSSDVAELLTLLGAASNEKSASTV